MKRYNPELPTYEDLNEADTDTMFWFIIAVIAIVTTLIFAMLYYHQSNTCILACHFPDDQAIVYYNESYDMFTDTELVKYHEWCHSFVKTDYEHFCKGDKK